DRPIPQTERQKIASFCNVRPEAVIAALDVDTIYACPIAYHEQGMDREVLRYFGLPHDTAPDLSRWEKIVRGVREPKGEVRIGIVGKYTALLDSYKSLAEALLHGGIAQDVRVHMNWIDAENLEDPAQLENQLRGIDGILVPGGFGERGSEGKINAVRYARENRIPFLGICFGMQMAVIECARSLAGLKKASSTEFGPTEEPLVGLMTEWARGTELLRRREGGDLGGTMRVGAYPAKLVEGSRVAAIYGKTDIRERHRHRWEVNVHYREVLEKTSLRFSGMSPDGVLPEVVEYPDHPWFIGVQYHPELLSKPFDPHPLFSGFIGAAKKEHQTREDKA
ncbi:MAG: CTP synthase, partial [Bombella apis]|nr:CTP synthase [Bombella apis]